MSKVDWKKVALAVAEAMDDKIAEEIKILKMIDVMVETDYFVICSCQTIVQMRAVAQSVLGTMDDLNIQINHQEGRHNNQWMLLDYGSLVVHIFLGEVREYYALEKLWADAEEIPFG